MTARPAGGAVPVERSPSPLLQGFTILELSTWIATPMATALLAELGARVIKIETLDGDPMRHFGPSGLKCVQGKESIALDLKTAEGRDIVHRLAERADALVHNYRPGVPERLGIDDTTLRALNPGLIHVYAASYGSTGPSSAKPAFHVTAGAVCGGALAQSGGDGAPGPDVELADEELARWSQRLTRCNEANPDFNAALAVATAVTIALYGRARTGNGQTVETRMMASNAYALSEHFIDYPGRPRRVLPDVGLHGRHALYRLYQARDGWIFVAAPADRDFARLCEALGQPRLLQDPRFSTSQVRADHDAELARELEAVFAQRRVDTWERDLVSARASHASGPTTVPTRPTSSTCHGRTSSASPKTRRRPGWVRTAGTAASCALLATSAPSALPTSRARRRAASWPSSATPTTGSTRCCPQESWADLPDRSTLRGIAAAAEHESSENIMMTVLAPDVASMVMSRPSNVEPLRLAAPRCARRRHEGTRRHRRRSTPIGAQRDRQRRAIDPPSAPSGRKRRDCRGGHLVSEPVRSRAAGSAKAASRRSYEPRSTTDSPPRPTTNDSAAATTPPRCAPRPPHSAPSWTSTEEQ